jgi:zinc ribbon protein
MAFCNACGTNVVPGTRFCSKCGAAILASTLPPPVANPTAPGAPVPPVAATVAAPPPASGGGALKAILIVVGVIVLVGILGLTSLAFIAWRVANRTRVRHEGDNVKVETPFGSVETTKDPQEAARNLGVDLYPGAQVLKDGSTTMTFGGVHTATLNSDTTDSADKVCSFYKPKYPNAMVMSTESDQCTIVSNDNKNTVTINVKSEGGRTHIVITHVGRSEASSSSN